MQLHIISIRLSKQLCYLCAGELGVPKALVTNAPRSNISVLLAALDLEQFFPPERQVFGDECPRGKPHPDPYLRGLELFNAHPLDTLAFEDSAVGKQVVCCCRHTLHESLLFQGCSPPYRRAFHRLA